MIETICLVQLVDAYPFDPPNVAAKGEPEKYLQDKTDVSKLKVGYFAFQEQDWAKFHEGQ